MSSNPNVGQCFTVKRTDVHTLGTDVPVFRARRGPGGRWQVGQPMVGLIVFIRDAALAALPDEFTVRITEIGLRCAFAAIEE